MITSKKDSQELNFWKKKKKIYIYIYISNVTSTLTLWTYQTNVKREAIYLVDKVNTHLGTIDGRENTKLIGETEPQQKSPDHVSVSDLKIWKVYYLVVLYIFLFSKVVASTACSCVGSDSFILRQLSAD